VKVDGCNNVQMSSDDQKHANVGERGGLGKRKLDNSILKRREKVNLREYDENKKKRDLKRRVRHRVENLHKEKEGINKHSLRENGQR